MSGKCSGLEEYQNVLNLFYSNTSTEKKKRKEKRYTNRTVMLYRNIIFEIRVCSLI